MNLIMRLARAGFHDSREVQLCGFVVVMLSAFSLLLNSFNLHGLHKSCNIACSTVLINGKDDTKQSCI